MSDPTPSNKDDDGFPAIDAENTNASPSSQDAIATNEQKSYFNDEPRLISQSHRYMRWVAFLVLGGITSVFLCSLLSFLNTLLSMESPVLAVLTQPGVDWHVWLVMILGLVIFAAVPLSLAAALVKMISSGEKDEEKTSNLVLPTTELAKRVLETIK